MGIFPEEDDNKIYFSRTNVEEPLASFSAHSFQLEGYEWSTVEHYFQAMKFENPDYQAKIRAADSPRLARKLGRTRFKRVRADWKKIRIVVMTRAVYTKCLAHSDVADTLIETGSKQLVENTQYDYFWGCGRDRRGKNQYGRVLMNVREKLLENMDV